MRLYVEYGPSRRYYSSHGAQILTRPITGNAEFLEPYDAAIGRIGNEFDELKRLTADNPIQQDRLNAIRVRVEVKLADLKKTIELRRTNPDAAVAAVASGRGKVEMDAVRKSVAEMQSEESRTMAERTGRGRSARGQQ